MSRKLGVCWIFLLITTAADATFIISKKGTFTWQEANTTDNFATPSIGVMNSSFTVNITVDVKKKEAWVGYYLKETAFAYIGCWHFKDAKPNASLPIEQNSPGFCYSMCDKSNRNYIGLRSDMCFCMSERPSEAINHTKCDISPDGTWLAGGGNEYISIYEQIKTDNVASSANNGKCLTFQRRSPSVWSICSRSYFVLCKKGDAIFTVYKNSQNYYKWFYYVQNCFENNSFPITYNDTVETSIELAVGPSWTNVIRSGVIYKYNEISNSIGGGYLVKYGYIYKSGDSVYLNFTRNSSEEKWYLLQTLPVSSPTSTQTQTSTASQTSHTLTALSTRFTSLDKGTVTKDPTSSPTVTFTSTITSTLSEGSVSYTTSTYSINDVSKTNTSKGADVSIPVSISVVAIILLAVIVVIVTLKRRRKLPGICTEHSAPDSTSERKAETILAEKNVYVESPISDYEQISELQDNNNVDVKPDLDVENGDYGHTYFVLEPGSRESHTDGDISDSRKEETEMNDDYNTLHLNKTFGAKADDTYDTTEKAAIKLKALRDTGCEKELPEKLNENEEDTYNHINRNLLKINKTDNIYGVTDNQENDYGDINNGCEKNIHDGDDTYSHLNTTH